jgi:hypothetical protein
MSFNMTPFNLPRNHASPGASGLSFQCTLFPTVDESLLQAVLDSHSNKINYFAYDVESCPTTGRPHNHIYFELKNALQVATISRWFIAVIHVHPHVECCFGTREQNLQYLAKEDTLKVLREAPPPLSCSSYYHFR